MSRIVETFVLGEILRKTANHKLTIFTISKMTYTPWPSPSRSNHRSTWCFPLLSAVDAARTPVFTTLQQLLPGQLAAVKSAVRNNRRKRALSDTVLYWPASLTADETARVKRDVASRSETFRDKNILARPRLSTRILDSCATLHRNVRQRNGYLLRYVFHFLMFRWPPKGIQPHHQRSAKAPS
jgi:hypothetical protein